MSARRYPASLVAEARNLYENEWSAYQIARIPARAASMSPTARSSTGATRRRRNASASSNATAPRDAPRGDRGRSRRWRFLVAS